MWTKCCNISIIKRRYHWYVFDKNVTRLLHHMEHLNILKTIKKNRKLWLKFHDFILLLLKGNKACCIDKGLHSFIYVLETCTCEIPSRLVHWLLSNQSGVPKGCLGQKTQNWTKFEIDSQNLFWIYLSNSFCNIIKILKCKMSSINSGYLYYCGFVCDWLNHLPSIVLQISSPPL